MARLVLPLGTAAPRILTELRLDGVAWFRLAAAAADNGTSTFPLSIFHRRVVVDRLFLSITKYFLHFFRSTQISWETKMRKINYFVFLPL
jgi:hypothetical protein